MILREFEEAAEQLARSAGVSLQVARQAIYHGDPSLVYDRDPPSGRRLQRLDARVRRHEERQMAREEKLGDAWEDYLDGDGQGSARQMSAHEEEAFLAWANRCGIEPV
jgi:hypothetical protein